MNDTIHPASHLDLALPPVASRRSVAGRTIPTTFEALEETAYDLAVLAGDRIVDTLGRALSVRYKDDRHGIMEPHDAVSNVDEAVEDCLRRRLAARHPDHAVIGEERGRSGPADAEFTWLIDPVDGTTNFVNGVPLFASTVAVLHRGVPVAGATWCATSHALRPGVYHARVGSRAYFDGLPLPFAGREVDGRRRRVSTAPPPVRPREATWDHLHLGTVSLEAALVAAGALASTRTRSVGAWSAAAGVVLAQAAGHEVWTEAAGRWEPFHGFGDEPEAWRQPILFGDSLAVTALRAGALAL